MGLEFVKYTFYTNIMFIYLSCKCYCTVCKFILFNQESYNLKIGEELSVIKEMSVYLNCGF